MPYNIQESNPLVIYLSWAFGAPVLCVILWPPQRLCVHAFNTPGAGVNWFPPPPFFCDWSVQCYDREGALFHIICNNLSITIYPISAWWGHIFYFKKKEKKTCQINFFLHLFRSKYFTLHEVIVKQNPTARLGLKCTWQRYKEDVEPDAAE